MYSYRKLLQTVFLFLLLFPHGTSTDISNGSIFWTLKTMPAVFGEDVQLQCYLGPERTAKNRARQWSRGQNQTLIMFNGNSTNADKFTEAYNKTIKISVLTIKNLEIDDVNIRYICQHGFSTYSNALKLMPDIYEYIPRGYRKVIREEAEQVFISIIFDRVYPLPVCTALLGKQNITDKLKIVSIAYESIYQSKISLTLIQATDECRQHQIDLFCLVGTENIKHSFKIPSKGNIEQKVKDQTLGEFGRGVFATVFACTLIAFVVSLLNGWFPAS